MTYNNNNNNTTSPVSTGVTASVQHDEAAFLGAAGGSAQPAVSTAAPFGAFNISPVVMGKLKWIQISNSR